MSKAWLSHVALVFLLSLTRACRRPSIHVGIHYDFLMPGALNYVLVEIDLVKLIARVALGR